MARVFATRHRIVLVERDPDPDDGRRSAWHGTLQEAIYRPLIVELAAGGYAPKSVKDLARALPSLTLAQVVKPIAVLVGGGHAAPCHAEPVVVQVRERFAVLNLHLMQRARISSDLIPLGSV